MDNEGRDMDSEEFRRLGHQVVDWIADYRERIAEFPVMAQVGPGKIRAKLPGAPRSGARRSGPDRYAWDLTLAISPFLRILSCQRAAGGRAG